ncbi:putative quinol monooxygenase [Desulfocurvibacter africanus]|uniref:putative quinol monooxygenase n=1 Tax=Desulfocurvibacter africanus TaxID=873 RepID=UPI00041BFBBC|nr:antibiotic biosynthesis monooxygenase [Desulfocurvibacter africanus]
MAIVRASLRMELSPHQLAEVLDVLSPLVSRTLAAPGCLECRLSRDLTDGSVLFEEWWAREEDFHERVLSGDFRTVLLTMDMAAKEPEFRFCLIAEIKGLKDLARLLGQEE